ncbi:MAG: indole-3-glycerol phosphate synthase TrpC [Flavobacteriaceae bacterium]|nr:indole-3-glycerol phosphate synthase TrpC [Flavobacteriaceae bacterium]
MDILQEIIAFKKLEVRQLKKDILIKNLVKSPNFKRTPISLKKALTCLNSTGIIAEFKRQSPSKGIINVKASVIEVTNGYLAANVAAQSVLTDTKFFGGNIGDVIKARSVNDTIPILRKDFIVDAFQIVEAKAIGADVILLIAAYLTKQELKKFGMLAEDLGLDVLYEVHNQEDLDKIELNNKIIGINNRNLKTFEVDLEHSIELASQIPSTCIKVSESGISDPKIVMGLKEYGFKGFLIGENFMKTDSPGKACKEFINQLPSLEGMSRSDRGV